MTTAHSHSTPPHDPHAGDTGAWPVLARIPDLSADARPAQRPSRPTPPVRPTGRRFDRPQPRAATAAVSEQLAEKRPEIGKHQAHSPQPPAHHLNQRAVRTTPIHNRRPAESPVLPDWNPFSIPGKRLPDAFVSILSFLVMVTLFTAAGTWMLTLRNSHQPPVSDVRPRTRIEQTADVPAAPTAAGPLGATVSRLMPSPPDAATTIETPALSPALAPSTEKNSAGNGVTGIHTTPEVAAPTADKDCSANEFLEPIFPPTIEVDLPQAATTSKPLPIARFSGQILEAPTRQAQHDDQSSIH